MTSASGLVTGRSARRAQTRERLMNSAVEVFAERGIFGASVEEISEHAGFTRGAFYSNFADKDDLVMALLRSYAERDVRTVEEITDLIRDNAGLRGNPPGVLINRALTRLLGDASNERSSILARHEMDLYAARHSALRRPYREYSEQLKQRIVALLDGTMQAIGLEFSVDVPTAVHLLHAATNRMQMEALLRDAAPDTGPIETLLTQITRPRTDTEHT
ncbi:TetR/AcrR family transcriptional regulator [Microlunatus sp. Gsoil 973]|uniref:TetR/AcrR family transcriptional regulator n=1 Tax=Microlunatus sp. Gsoil 973 TaxID=2672569 RepID=UPI0018A83F84|nr:TetR/AcrR family transcriptional regulator [Microlunatus sp. Gsoil 973]